VFEIINLNERLGQTNFLNRPSHRYDLLKEGSHDAKSDQLICQNLQLHAIVFFVRHAILHRIYLPSCYAMHDGYP
jgi:hypothetical protein